MSAPLSSEDRQHYTSVIDAILATADLETVTRKKIRQGLEQALGGKDLSEQKYAIKALIEERFDAVSAMSAAMPTPPSAPPTSDDRHSLKRQNSETNGHDAEDDDNASAEIKVSTEEPVKKKKKLSKRDDADARLAAELQAQEDRLARGRTTRGGGPAKSSKPKKKTPKKKSATKVKGGDDSDGSSDASGAAEKRKPGGGFQKPFNLSYPLADLCGEPQLSRPQVVKKLWAHIKANELQDPNDKRQILCDDKMQAIFKQSKVDMFQMNKLLGSQLYPIEE